MILEPPLFVLIFTIMFKKVLSKKQRKHFSFFMTQRIVSSPKHMTVRNLKRLFVNPPSTNASLQFLSAPINMWRKIKEKRKEILVKNFKSAKGSLIIDDTFCYKTGKKMKDIYENFCHLLKKKVLSHVVVTSVYKTPHVSIGYDFKVYIPEAIASTFKTKYELALEMIKDAYSRGLIKRVYFDSWFCQPALLKKLKPMGLEFFGMFRIGRLKIKSRGEYKCLDAFVDKIIATGNLTYKKLKGRKKTYKIRFYREIVYIRHVGKVNLVISQKYDQKSRTYSEPRVYVTNVLSLRALEVIRTYLNRWDVEVFHKTAKQAYGFEDYQVVKAQARDAYLELAFLSDMLLQLKQRGQLKEYRVDVYAPHIIPIEKICTEDLVLSALSAQKKGILKEFVKMCKFSPERFRHLS